MAGHAHPYLDLLAPRLSEAASEWLMSHYDRLDATNFAVIYAGAGRRLGVGALLPSTDEIKSLSAAGLVVPTGWPLSGVGRATLLARICQTLDADAHLPLVVA